MTRITEVAVGPVLIGEGRPLALLAGPCVIESERHTIRLAEAIREICARLSFPFIFKASFDKANRSSIESYRGPGLDEGLRILAKTRDAIDGPVVTDIHEASQAQPVGEVLDLIQIPAFLCRQTDLLAAAAKTGKPVNAKKGQFLSPEEMKNVVDKIKANGNEQVLLTERGTFFGYNRLVNDMTAIPRMRALAPVVFDATHSCQMPGGLGFQSGGNREYAATLAQAAVAAGADAIFIEVHDDPDNAMSDPATVWPLDQLEALLSKCQAIKAAVCGTG
ncbi:MAG: 3-deoxy-8-phosphooctulonate synthase [Planctomycetes bacterium]|nr:3-deoxy-8-phosphooctulonate synthase [Planctomycetota bacterium]